AAPEVSPALAHVVERCLTRDVEARVGSAEELLRLLRAPPAAADEPTTTKFVPPQPAASPMVEPTVRTTVPFKEVEGAAGTAARVRSPLASAPPRRGSMAIAGVVLSGVAVTFGVVIATAKREAPAPAETTATTASPTTASPTEAQTQEPAHPVPLQPE